MYVFISFSPKTLGALTKSVVDRYPHARYKDGDVHGGSLLPACCFRNSVLYRVSRVPTGQDPYEQTRNSAVQKQMVLVQTLRDETWEMLADYGGAEKRRTTNACGVGCKGEGRVYADDASSRRTHACQTKRMRT